MILMIAVAGLMQAVTPVLENDYVRVIRDAAPCATTNAYCGDRVVVALSSFDLHAHGKTLKMERGGIAVFRPGES